MGTKNSTPAITTARRFIDSPLLLRDSKRFNGRWHDFSGGGLRLSSYDQALQRLLAKAKEQNRCEESVQQCRTDQASENGHSDGVKNFLSRRGRIDGEWQKGQTGRPGR